MKELYNKRWKERTRKQNVNQRLSQQEIGLKGIISEQRKHVQTRMEHITE